MKFMWLISLVINLSRTIYSSDAATLYEGLTPRPFVSEFATDIQTDGGLHIQMPFYRDEEMESLLKEMADHEAEENLIKFRDIADRIFQDPTEMRIYKWPSLGVEVVSMRLKQLRERPEEYKDLPLSSLMGNFNLNMFSEILKESEIRAKEFASSSSRVDASVVQEKVDRMANSLIQAFKANPTSTNVDYERMKIDGQSFPDYVADLMSELRNNNFGALLTLMDKILHLLPGL